MRLTFDVTTRGAVLEGEGPEIMAAYSIHLENSIADMAVTRIRAYLPTQYMYLGHNGGTPEFNPVPADAGYLASMVHAERSTDNAVLVTSDPATYGAWIEGTDDLNLVVWPHYRNPPPRRFPGYAAFRKIAQQLDAEAEEIAQLELGPYLEELNS